MKQEFYTKETIKDAFNSLTVCQKAYIRDIASIIAERKIENDDIVKNLIYYIENINDVEKTCEPYEDILQLYL